MNVLIIIIGILMVLYATLMIVYRIGWHKSKRNWESCNRPALDESDYATFSIIVPARNEAPNIEGLLSSLIDIDYAVEKYEVIVIDDFSTDDTAQLVTGFAAKHSSFNIRLLRLADYLSAEDRINAFKKTALSIAIDSARFDYVITIDADCLVPKTLLKSYNERFSDQKVKFVAAPVQFIPYKSKENVLFYFQALDFMTMQGITPAVNTLGLGNMCNGANLGFSKAAFYEVGGYKGLTHLASGDDMMLMHKFSKHFGSAIAYLHSSDAIVKTYTQPSWNDFLQQRIRWASKSGKYNDKPLNASLMLIYAFNFVILLTTLLCFLCECVYQFVIIVWLFKILVELIFLYPVSKFYLARNQLYIFPFLQPLHVFYIVLVGFLGMVGKYQWKGRVVK